MNKNALHLVRAAALAAALVALSVPGFAGESPKQPEDLALKLMDQTGSLSVDSVAGVRIGSSLKEAFGALGPADRVLADGTWVIYKDFHVNNSVAHGTLAVSLKDGRVSALRVVSPAVAVALVAHRGCAVDQVVVASNR
jgi:hypothetical protein